MELGKPESVVEKLVTQYLKDEAHKAWIASMQSEYDALYPASREMTDEEKAEYSLNYLESNTDIDVMPEDFEYPSVEIDYSEDDTYMTFTEWLNETNTILVGSKELLDENGEPTGETEDITQDVPVRPEPEHVIDLQSWKDEHFKPYKKTVVRKKIRDFKDLEDDVVDTKVILQWVAYALSDIYSVLTDEQKENLKYGQNIDMFTAMLQVPENKLRVDVEPDPLAKVQKIFADEIMFADIVKTEYLD